MSGRLTASVPDSPQQLSLIHISGNVATEDVLYMLRGLDIDTGVDFDAVVDIGQWMSANLNRKGSSRAGNAIAAKRAA